MFDVLQAQENPGQFFPLAAVETHGGANAARAEKPRLGLSSFKTASHLGFAVCNSTTALGLQAGWAENRGGAYRWARYYNSLTGRFLSRDPEAGKPIDPKTLHKYLYAGGDPANRIDPSGRDEEGDYITLSVRSMRIILKEAQAYQDCLDLLISITFASEEEFLALSMRDELLFNEVMDGLIARCFNGLFANLN